MYICLDRFQNYINTKDENYFKTEREELIEFFINCGNNIKCGSKNHIKI